MKQSLENILTRAENRAYQYNKIELIYRELI